MLAPELQELERRYSDLLARVDAGTLDFDAALETLGHLTCSDADGFQWGISPEGEPPDTVFLRSSLGGAPVPADPVVFAAAPSATPAWAATPPTVDGPSSSDHPYSFGPNPAQPQQPYTQQPHAGPHPSETDWTTYSGHETPKRETKLSNLTGAFSKLTATVNQVIHPGAAGESDSTRTGPNRRTVFVVIAALVVLLVTVVFLRDDNSSGKPPAGGEPASIECPELTAPVTGISPEEAKLLGCLDGVADPASPQYGPQIARLAVTVNEDNSITYDPALAMTQGDVLSTAVALYFFAGGRPPAESVAVDLAAVPEALQADVQNAVDLGFVKPDAVAVDQPATKADLTVVLATILAGAANADPTTPSQAADAASASEQASAAQAYLVSRGVVPGGTGAFGFAEPLTATTWIDMTAPAVFELQKPGQLAASAAPPRSSPKKPLMKRSPLSPPGGWNWLLL